MNARPLTPALLFAALLLARSATAATKPHPAATTKAPEAGGAPEKAGAPAKPETPETQGKVPASDTKEGQAGEPKRKKESRPSPPPGDAAALNEQGIEEARSGHFVEAIDHLKAAIDIDRVNPLYWNNLGSVYLTEGRHLLAERSFRRALKLDPNNAPAYYNLGAVRDAMLDYDGAVEAYARALELDPGLADPANNPPIVNNSHMTAVNLLIYQRKIGALGTPLASAKGPKDSPGSRVAPKEPMNHKGR